MGGVASPRATRWWLDRDMVEGYVHGVFEGGGAKGVLYVGALRALLQRKLWFSAVAGSSAGAITAALLAAGATPDEIEETTAGGLDALDPPTTWSGVRRLSKAVGLLDRDALREWLGSILRAKCGIEGDQAGPTFGQLYDLSNIDLFVVAVDLTVGRLAVFNRKLTPACQVADTVVASATIPLAFEPSRFASRDAEGKPVRGSVRYFADGGIASNFPTFVFRDPAFRKSVHLDAFDDQPLVGFLLEEPQRATDSDLPYLHGKFEGTYHDFMRALSDDRKYRTPRFHKRKKRAGEPRKGGWKRPFSWIQIGLLSLFNWLALGFTSGEWPGEWPPSGGAAADGGPSKENGKRGGDRRLGLLLKALRRWVTISPAVLVLGTAVYTVVFWVGAALVFQSLVPGGVSSSNFTDIKSLLSLVFSWLLTLAVLVFAVMVWLMGLLSFALVRIGYRTTALYGAYFARTFFHTPAAPPWAGMGPNETVVRLPVPEGFTTMGVSDRDQIPRILGECERIALSQLENVQGNPTFPSLAAT